MMTSSRGIVYLVGAGPGEAGLITVRGVDCLRRADVVIYDNLANGELLRYAPEHAELIYAGKKADQHTKTQDEINAILAEKAAAGLTVVRLKGGDPFLFGRGGEEAGWLVEHGIAWEVVPGVTSAIAVPAYAGIPVTHRNVNGSLHVVTGHENRESLGADIDWSVLAKSRGTIVLLMGVKNLGMISTELMRHGMTGETPVALVQWGTRAAQKTVVSTLDSIVEAAERGGIKPPAVTIIGEVVSLRETLAWVEKRPLYGITIAVTRPVDENEALAGRLEALGAEVVRTPTLRVEPVDTGESLVQQLAVAHEKLYDWLVFTSANGVRYFMKLLLASNLDVRALAGISIAVIGARTADSLRNHGLKPDLVSEESTQEGLAGVLCEKRPRRVVIARALEARPVLEEQLQCAGAEVIVLPVYQTVPDERGIERLRAMLGANKVDMVTFTSAKTFKELGDALESSGELPKELFNQCAIGVIGPVTRAAVEMAGLNVDLESSRPDMESFVNAIAEWRRSFNK